MSDSNADKPPAFLLQALRGMVGHKIGATLPSSGGGNRGICRERNGFLLATEELKSITKEANGACRGITLGAEKVAISTDAVSSMNIWAFTPSIIRHMSEHFAAFLEMQGTSLTAESYVADVVDGLLRDGKADCRILETDSLWFGVTYPHRVHCQEGIRQLIASGDYQADLWQQCRDA